MDYFPPLISAIGSIAQELNSINSNLLFLCKIQNEMLDKINKLQEDVHHQVNVLDQFDQGSGPGLGELHHDEFKVGNGITVVT